MNNPKLLQKSQNIKAITLVLAFATGVAVANLYYLQPILNQVKLALNIKEPQAALLVTFTQIGYALGLLFLVPLGDVFERKKLASLLFLVAVIFLLIASSAINYASLAFCLTFIGATSVVTHILVPYAADLAPSGQQGKVVAQVMSGLLTGILLSRAFSGIIANYLGWQSVYLMSAFLLIISMALILKTLPKEPYKSRVSYKKLLSSSFLLLKRFPTLLYRTILGSLTFGGFTILWTILAFLLSKAPYKFSPLIIGLFSIIGLGGIIAANVAGRLSDRGYVKLNTILSGTLLAAGFLILYFFQNILGILIIGISLIDLSAQSMQITNQSVIFTLEASSRSRINSIYMTGYFIIGAISSGLAGIFYAHGGWKSDCLFGLSLSVVAVALASLQFIKSKLAHL